MKKITLLALAFVSFCFITISCKQNTGNDHKCCDSTDKKHCDTLTKDSLHANHAEHEKHWSYEGETGPANWYSLKEEYKDCNGKVQSPVDIAGAVKDKTLKALQIKYTPATELELINNGHTIQINYADGIFTLNGVEYHILQFHFHCPSEHTVKGESFPMEVHLVHSTPDKKLAVIGILVKEGTENAFFKKFWDILPKSKDEKVTSDLALNISEFLPKEKGYYNLTGSLTTPPCSEGVQWFVMKTPVQASKEQIETIKKFMPEHNARPVQALNDRKILEF